MERKGSIVLVEKVGIAGRISFGTAIRFENQTLPVVQFTDEHDLHKPAPKVEYAEADGLPLWKGLYGIEFEDPHLVAVDNRRRGRLKVYLCPKQDRAAQFAQRLGLSLHKGGLAGDGVISRSDLNYDETVTHFPNLFQNRQ